MRTMNQTEEQTDTEITLGMTSLLGIFFGLVLICGVFFGLGYSLGRHPSAESPAASASVTQTADDSAAAAARAKPSAQQALQAADSGLPSADNSTPAPSTEAATTDGPAVTRPNAQLVSASQPTTASAARPQSAQLKSAVATPTLAAAQPVAARATSPAVLTPATVVSATPTMVQIAAVSRQEDADVLVSALKSHGFNVTVRNEAQDRLLHVQVGPFASRDQAKAMRQKLLEAGYNAILKP